jgi:hypothetical protein
MHRLSLLAGLLCLALSCPGAEIQLNTFYQFAFGEAGIPATGCDPADPNGPFCIGDPALTLPAPAPAWSFTLNQLGTLRIIDALEAGDSFQLEMNGINASTIFNAPANQNGCDIDPVVCQSAPGIATLAVDLGPGAYSFDIRALNSPQGGGIGFFIVESNNVVPEPTTYFLSACLLTGLCIFRKRQLAVQS